MNNNNPDKCIIVVPTHSSYLDVCDIFFKLFYKYWPDCPYKIVLAITGNSNCQLPDNTQVIYCDDYSLPGCIRKVSEQYNSLSYMVFLGDSFFINPVDTLKVQDMVNEFIQRKLRYCRLHIQKMKSKPVMLSNNFIKLNTHDRYGISFSYFLASKSFIEEEFSTQISDLDFENKYLNKAMLEKEYYDDIVMLNHRLFTIVPGIEKGKLDRIAALRIKTKNPEIMLSNREFLSIKDEFYLILRRIFIIAFPEQLRRSVKKVIGKSTSRFTTKN